MDDIQRKILLDAANLIESNGWYNSNTMTCPTEAVCAYVAIARCSQPYEGQWQNYWRGVQRIFINFIGETDVIAWNDHQINGDVVIKALRDCAEQA